MLTLTVATLGLAAGCNPLSNALDGLNAQQQNALEAAADQIESLAGLAGGTSGVANQDDPNGKPRNNAVDSNCPAITLTLSNSAFSATFDFGDGCTPDLYPDVTFSGSVTGTLTFNPFSVDLTYTDFSNGERSITGTASHDITVTSGSATVNFDSIISFENDLGETLAGTTSWNVNFTTGLITIETIDGEGEDVSGDAFTLDAQTLVIDVPGNGNFVPESGTATIVVTDVGLFGQTTQSTIVVTFSEQTPVDGTVTVTGDGGEPFEYQIDI